MAKKATLQIRMDADLKEKVEALYRDMGTSFAEAVRIFAKQSVQENGMPFAMTANRKNTYGRLSRYADTKLAATHRCRRKPDRWLRMVLSPCRRSLRKSSMF